MRSCPQITEPSLDCEPTAGEDILADPPLESQARTGFWEVERLRAEYARLGEWTFTFYLPTLVQIADDPDGVIRSPSDSG